MDGRLCAATRSDGYLRPRELRECRAREITRALDQRRTEEVAKLAAREGAFTVMNRMLRLANLDTSNSRTRVCSETQMSCTFAGRSTMVKRP